MAVMSEMKVGRSLYLISFNFGLFFGWTDHACPHKTPVVGNKQS